MRIDFLEVRGQFPEMKQHKIADIDGDGAYLPREGEMVNIFFQDGEDVIFTVAKVVHVLKTGAPRIDCYLVRNK